MHAWVCYPLFTLPSALTFTTLVTIFLPVTTPFVWSLHLVEEQHVPALFCFTAHDLSQRRRKEKQKKAGRCSQSLKHVRIVDPAPQLFGCTWSIVLFRVQRASALTDVWVIVVFQWGVKQVLWILAICCHVSGQLTALSGHDMKHIQRAGQQW